MYKVKTQVEESNELYFFGDQIVDQVKDADDNILYSRNLLRNSALTGNQYWFQAKTGSLDWNVTNEVTDGMNCKRMELLSAKTSGQWGYLYNNSLENVVEFEDGEVISIGLTAKSDPVVPINVGLSNVQNNSSTLLAKTFNPTTEFTIFNHTGEAKTGLPTLFKIDLTGPSILPENSVFIGCKAYVQKGEQGPYSVAPEDILV
ncbi:hypothetical protein [Enterococcus hirae]|uniref:hypothetical protein n=1 Tax=Enterococcus hirae TaxID=1354 RepID=UPI00383E3A9F